MNHVRILCVLLAVAMLTVPACKKDAAQEAPPTQSAETPTPAPPPEPFMGLAHDQEETFDPGDGREPVVIMTKVYPNMWATYAYLKSIDQVIEEDHVDGRAYFAVARTAEVPPVFGGDEPETVELVRRYVCKIPEGYPGFSDLVPPDRIHEAVPVAENPFVNVTPAVLALICESSAFNYRLDIWGGPGRDFVWAAVRAMERGELECPVLTSIARTSDEIERRVLSGYSFSWRASEGELTREGIERRIWGVRPGWADLVDDQDAVHPVDCAKSVTVADLLAHFISLYDFRSITISALRYRGEDTDDWNLFKEEVREACQRLVDGDCLVPGEALIARGTIPPEKQPLYDRACAKAQFLGAYMLRDLLVDLAAIEMGLSEKSPDEQAALIVAWEEQMNSVRDYIEERDASALLSFPGPRPWLSSAADAMGIDSGLTDVDLAAEESLDAFIDALDSDDVVLRRQAAWDLARLSIAAAPASAELIDALADEDAQVRRNAAMAIMRIGGVTPQPAETAAALLGILAESEEADTRLLAVRAIGEIGDHSEETVDALLLVLAEDEGVLSYLVASALDTPGADTDALLPRLLEMLKSDNPAAITGAARAIYQIEYDAEQIGDALVPVMSHDNAETCAAAIQAMAKINLEHEAVLPAVLALFESDAKLARSSAVWMLGRLGHEGDTVIPLLLEALTDSDENVVRSAGYSLSSVIPRAEDVPALLALLSHESPATRAATAYALSGAAVPDKTPILEALVALLSDPDSKVRSAVFNALLQFEEDREAILPELKALVEETEYSDVRSFTAWMIEDIESPEDEDDAEE